MTAARPGRRQQGPETGPTGAPQDHVEEARPARVGHRASRRANRQQVAHALLEFGAIVGRVEIGELVGGVPVLKRSTRSTARPRWSRASGRPAGFASASGGAEALLPLQMTTTLGAGLVRMPGGAQ